jgi:hypothetical protein
LLDDIVHKQRHCLFFHFQAAISVMGVHDDVSLSSRGAQQANVAIAFLVLAWVFILLRVWTRIYVISNFGWDDSTMILAGVRRDFLWRYHWHWLTLRRSFSPYIAQQCCKYKNPGSELSISDIEDRYIEANGGGTHIKDLSQLVNLTKVGGTLIVFFKPFKPNICSGRLWERPHTWGLS